MGGPGAPPATRCNLSPEVTHEGFPALSLNLSRATIEKNMGRGGPKEIARMMKGLVKNRCLLIRPYFRAGGGIGGIYPYILMKQVT